MKPLKLVYLVLLTALTPAPKSFMALTCVVCAATYVASSLLTPSNAKSFELFANYYKCLAFVNFDGLTCEIFFNTFKSFKVTMQSVITVTPLMAIYPLSRFFRLKHKKLMSSPDILIFVFSFLLWLNFFFDPYNSEFELFFAVLLMLFSFFSVGFAISFAFCLIYISTSLMRAFNLPNYTEFSYHESTSTNMFNYITYASVSIVYILSFSRLKRLKKRHAKSANPTPSD